MFYSLDLIIDVIPLSKFNPKKWSSLLHLVNSVSADDATEVSIVAINSASLDDSIEVCTVIIDSISENNAIKVRAVAIDRVSANGSIEVSEVSLSNRQSVVFRFGKSSRDAAEYFTFFDLLPK